MDKNLIFDERNIIPDNLVIKQPKLIAKMKMFGGALELSFYDNSNFKMPTPKQCENLKETFGIEVISYDNPELLEG